MRDGPLVRAVRAPLLARLAVYGVTAEVKQSYQPTQQGRPEGPCVFMHNVGNRRHGFPEQSDKFDVDALEMLHTESAQIESTWQFSAIVDLDPSDLDALTASDVLKAAAAALQSDPVLASLRAAGVGVLRVREIRNGHVLNDEAQFEANPTFDVTFTHRDTFVETAPVVAGTEIIIARV